MRSEKSVDSKSERAVREVWLDFTSGPRTSWTRRFSVDFIGVFLVFFLSGLERVPSVNEPHYWTKAAHFWNPAVASGDLFLESANAHWLFYATFGALTLVLPIEQSVWAGRMLLWGLLTLGWTWMMRRAFLSGGQKYPAAWVATFSALAWCTAMRWGHLSGEWVVGGAEAKVAAYGLIFLAFGFFFSKRWTLGWLSMRLASGMHVVVGLWVFLGSLFASCLLDWLSPEESTGSLRSTIKAWWLKHGWGVPLAVLGLSLGMLPPLLADSQATSEVSTQAAMIQVYKRLGHHLAATSMALARWRCFGNLLLIAFLVLVGCIAYGSAAPRLLGSKRKVKVLAQSRWSAWPYGLRWFLIQALFGLLIAVVGCMIDWGSLTGLWSRELSAKVLKYYWFRWNDVALGIWVAAGAVWLASGSARLASTAKDPFGVMAGYGKRVSVPEFMLASVLFFGLWGLYDRIGTRGNDWLGEGERARLLSKSDGFDEQLLHYQDWLNVCEFVKKSTKPGALWLTPRNQQTFKWHTGRAEVAAWKDMPQDSASVVEWFDRLQECYPVDDERSLVPWTTQKIMELHQRYGFGYVLIDKRIDGQSPPLLPLVYPKTAQDNSTFAVFQIPR